MIAIFGGVFAILGFILFLVCRFMKSKDTEYRRVNKRGGQHNTSDDKHHDDGSD